jgi:hypothetical protein
MIYTKQPAGRNGSSDGHGGLSPAHGDDRAAAALLLLLAKNAQQQTGTPTCAHHVCCYSEVDCEIFNGQNNHKTKSQRHTQNVACMLRAWELSPRPVCAR